MSRRETKRKKRKISVFKILALLLLMISIFFAIIVYKINVLPNKYYVLLLLGIGFVNILFSSFLMRKKAKRKVRIFFSVLAFIVIGLMAFCSYYILNTLGFLSKIKLVDYKLENYSVLVLKNSEYEKISDIKGLDVGYYSISEGASKANNEISDKVDVTFKEYSDATELSTDLLNDDLKVMVVEDSILSMIKEDNADFESQTRVIYKFSIKIKTNNQAKEVDVTAKPFNIYISGIDTYGEISSVSRSDVNMVMTVNPKTKQILLTSIPRDYYVQLHGTTGTRDKLTHAGMYGVDMSISTIEDLLDIEINYYIKVNFTSLIDIVDALGGITVYSDYTFTSIDGKHFTKGNNAMNGEQALSFARERKAFSEGDRQRGKDQQAVISAIIKKVCSKSILSKYDSLLNSLEGKFQTNMSSKKITSLIKMQLNDMASWNVSTYNLEGVDSSNYTYSGGNTKLYVMEPVQGSVKKAGELIGKVINGKKLESSYTYDGPINTVTNSSNEEKTTNNKSSQPSIETAKDTKDYEYPKCKDPENGLCTIKSTIEIEPKYICDDGYSPTQDKTQCFKDGADVIDPDYYKEIKLECDSDYILESGKCNGEKTESVAVCESGYTYQKNGMVCCPNGYSYSDSVSKCVEN